MTKVWFLLASVVTLVTWLGVNMMGFHSFSQEAWGLLGIGGAATWKMGTDRDTTVQKK